MDIGRSSTPGGEGVALARLTPNPVVSFIVSCLHGREALGESLARIERCGLRRDEFEIFLVGPASPDPQEHLATKRFPVIQLMAQAENPRVQTLGAAVGAARGRYVMLLDDDSHPRPGSVLRMTTHFERNSKLAAAVFTVTRPDGTHLHPPYPNLILRCGTALRRRMMEYVDLPPTLVEPGAACELSLRILEAGLEISTFDDLHVTHEDLEGARSDLALRREVRDNLLLAARYFPQKWVLPFARDWLKRQRFVASAAGQQRAYYKGLLAGLAKAMNPARRRPVDTQTFESLVRMEQTRDQLRRLRSRHRLRSILLLDYSPNLLAFYLAARECNLDVAAIADPTLAGSRRKYRRIPVLGDEEARQLSFDAAIVTTLCPTKAAERMRQFRRIDARPVYDLFEPSGSVIRFGSGTTFGAAWESHRTAARSA